MRGATTSRDALAEVLIAHYLQGDTARQYDAAGQCTCGAKFYEIGGDPGAFLGAHRRLLDAHAKHVANALPVVDVSTLADALEQRLRNVREFGEYGTPYYNGAAHMLRTLAAALEGGER